MNTEDSAFKKSITTSRLHFNDNICLCIFHTDPHTRTHTNMSYFYPIENMKRTVRFSNIQFGGVLNLVGEYS